MFEVQFFVFGLLSFAKIEKFAKLIPAKISSSKVVFEKKLVDSFLFFESEKRNIPCIVYYYFNLLLHIKQFNIRPPRAK